jgi:hypothetical protein
VFPSISIFSKISSQHKPFCRFKWWSDFSWNFFGNKWNWSWSPAWKKFRRHLFQLALQSSPNNVIWETAIQKKGDFGAWQNFPKASSEMPEPHESAVGTVQGHVCILTRSQLPVKYSCKIWSNLAQNSEECQDLANGASNRTRFKRRM